MEVDDDDNEKKKDPRLSLRPPRTALHAKKYRMIPRIKLNGHQKAKDGLREYLRRLPKSAGS